MRIISLNLRYAHDSEMNNQGIREPRIVDFIKNTRPDLLGTQESEKFWLERLTATIGKLGYAPAQDEAYSEGGDYAFKNFIWYDTEKNELIDGGRIWLSETSLSPSKGFGSRFYISAGYAVIKDKTTGKCEAYVNTHLDAYKQHARSAEIEVLKAKIKELEDKGYTVFVTGDFNDDQDSDVYRAMTEELLDARETAKESTQTNTFNFCNSEGMIIPKEKYRRLDYCFHNCDRTGAVVEKFDVVDRWTDGYMSDHNALVIDFEI